MKKKALNTSTFICNVSLSTNLFLTRNVLVEWFLLLLDASVLTCLNYSFIYTFSNLTCLLPTFPLEFKITEELMILLNLYLSIADFFLWFFEKLPACFIFSLKCLLRDFAYQSFTVTEVCLLALHFFNSLYEDHKLCHFLFTLTQIAFLLLYSQPFLLYWLGSKLEKDFTVSSSLSKNCLPRSGWTVWVLLYYFPFV